MSRIIIAVILVLIVLITVYVNTRSLPSPNTPTGPCYKNTDCQNSWTCINGVCTDTTLPILLNAAQQAATNLNAEVQSLYSYINNIDDMIGSVTSEIVAINNSYEVSVSGGITVPLSNTLFNDTAAASAMIESVINYLTVPSCTPTPSSACGYIAQILALTPTSLSGNIIVTTSGTLSGVPSKLKLITDGGLSSVTADLQNFASQITSQISTITSTYQYKVAAVVNGITSYINDINASVAAILNLGTAMVQAGIDLYNHMVPS